MLGKARHRNRDLFREIAQETLRIFEAGHYRNDQGELVSVRELAENAVSGSVHYGKDHVFRVTKGGEYNTETFVCNLSTLKAGQAMKEMMGHDGTVTVLNFASAKRPGGGFRKGANAQEESLARTSCLYSCLEQFLQRGNMYDVNKHCDLLYTDCAIFSPDIPFIRTCDPIWSTFSSPLRLSVITIPAPNAGAFLEKTKKTKQDLKKVDIALRKRIERMLNIAKENRCANLVLGAFGCGVFQNSSRDVANIFKDLLDGKFKGVFKTVCFAITTRSSEESTKIYSPFCELFGQR
uniref:Microbial-type PARG catalytic domain-containing protein n=1 Tax=Mucochytrium quahogii TaxID=96639 RepID=A0A7S2RNQ6_9STRA|mmetsp:Transcript_15243/g.24755  ORF Transcript_15243/g.24755 Transcript_15243/m.24755 type:complete len:293 (-) Transcript_15243:351-1229(-)